MHTQTAEAIMHACQPKPPTEPRQAQPTDTQESIDQCSLDEIKKKILSHKDHAELSFIEMGKLLLEAKSRIKHDHGQWLPWLRDNIEISHVTACRLMKIAREFSNVSPVTHLGFAKVSMLVSLPPDKREKFIAEEHEIEGVMKNIEDMTKRELQSAVNKQKTTCRPSPIEKSDKEFTFECKRRNSSSNDPVRVFVKDLNVLQERVDSVLAQYLENPTYEEAVDALRMFCEATLKKIPVDEFHIG